MTESPDAPDRFGCLTVAQTIFMALFAVLAILLFMLMNDSGLRQTIQNMINAQQDDTGPGTGGDIPPVSDRYFSSGGVRANVSGDLSFNVDLPLDDIRSYAARGMGWIAFGEVIDSTGPVALVVLNEPENSVAVSQGARTALGVDAQCSWDVTVTATLVSGHVSCAHADVIEDGEVVGSVAIELDFSAGSSGGSGPGESFEPGEGEGGEPDDTPDPDQ